jgi:peptidyl-dipeptidase Dcp
MKKALFTLIIITMAVSSCKKQEKSDNPFFSKYDTPFEVPPFEKIKNKHYMPAFLRGMEEQKKEIRAIITNSDEPTFENTIKPLIYSGDLLQKAGANSGSRNFTG